MTKPKTQRDVQVRHRLSGAALLGVRDPSPPTMAIDARPTAGDMALARRALHGEQVTPGMRRALNNIADALDPRPLTMRGAFGDEETPPMVEEIDD